MHPQSTGVPELVVLAPEEDRGRRIPLPAERTVVGREGDLRFDDPFLGRRHALLQRQGDAVYVRDLGSRNGTFINHTSAAADQQLRTGDVLKLGGVQLQLEPAGPAGGIHVREQVAAKIDNIEGSQHNYEIRYVQYIQQRNDYLHEVAALRTKARWVVWPGFLLFIAGFGLFAAGLLSFMGQAVESFETNRPPDGVDLLGPDVLGLPSALLGWAVAGVGAVLLLLGIVLHAIAAARRRDVDRKVPPPAGLVPGELGADRHGDPHW